MQFLATTSRSWPPIHPWLSLWAGCLALAEWCAPNRWPVTACKRSKQCRAWANVQPLLLHHATRIVVWHWSYNYQYDQIPTDCDMLSTRRESWVASCIGCLAKACKSWSLVRNGVSPEMALWVTANQVANSLWTRRFNSPSSTCNDRLS